MRITLNDEEVREAISLLLEKKGITVLDSTIQFSIPDYNDGVNNIGEVTFSAEVEKLTNN